MKLLMVTPSSPYPPTSGAAIRRWEQLRYLARRHDVTAVFYRRHDIPPAQSSLDTVCRPVPIPHPPRLADEDLAISRGAPWPLRWYGTAGMARTLREIRPGTFDAVIVDSLYMTLYPELREGRSILQEHNIESQLARQRSERRTGTPAPHGSGSPVVWRAAALQMEAYENRIWPVFPLRVTVSTADKAVIDGRCPVGRTVVVENGTDVTAPVVHREPGPRSVLFTGALDYFPNIDAVFFLANAIMPAVWTRQPDIHLIIAGRSPDPALWALASHPRVQLVATPVDMRPVAAQASVSAVPLRLGGGTRVKILDSLTWGLPVVSTSVGCAGLDVTDGEHVVVRDDPDAFADAVVGLLSDPVRWRQLSHAGRMHVERRYGWDTLLAQFEGELSRLVDAPAKSADDRSRAVAID